MFLDALKLKIFYLLYLSIFWYFIIFKTKPMDS